MIKTLLLIGVLVSGKLALAGTQLHLQSGSINTNEIVHTLMQTASAGLSDVVVQFKEAITEQDKKALTSYGAEILRYLPDDALIVRGSYTDLKAKALLNAKIHAVVPFQSAWRLSDNLPVLSLLMSGKKDVLLVTLFRESDLVSVEQQIRKLDPSARIINSEERYVTVYSEVNSIAQFARITGVEFVQKIEPMTPFHFSMLNEVPAQDLEGQASGDYSDLTGFETGTRIMNFSSAWSAGFNGKGQIVAMADTGLDTGDLRTVAEDFKSAIKSGYYFGAGAKSWDDPMGHGTHVGGSVVSRGTASGGRLLGGAYGAQFIPQSMWSPILDNLNVPPQMSKMFEPAYNDGARIHTNSWGSAASFGVYESMAQKVDEFMWKNPEFLLVFAAGNSGVDKDKNGKIDNNSIATPGTAKNCLTVGASENFETKGGIQKQVSDLKSAKDSWPAEPIWSSKLSDDPNGIAVFSSRGPTKDKRIKPEVVAPGTNILSNRSHVKDASILWGAYNDHYAWSGGTSMATPLVAGAAAVTRQILIEKHQVSQPSAAVVKAMLMNTAFDMYPGQYGEGSATQELARRPNPDEGFGRVDMSSVVSLSGLVVDDKQGVAQGAQKNFTLQVSQPGRIMINLVYTDAPGSLTAGQTLVNNLDLSLVAPDGTIVEAKDSVNNHEVIERDLTQVGQYKIIVHGAKIPMGKNGLQPFALVSAVR